MSREPLTHLHLFRFTHLLLKQPLDGTVTPKIFHAASQRVKEQVTQDGIYCTQLYIQAHISQDM